MIKTSPLFMPAPFFFVRTAHFPVDHFLRLCQQEDVYSHLRSLFETNSLLREAIAIASPTLYEQLLSNPQDEQLLSSLLKYVLRMSTRATPFGLFSFVSFGKWSEKTNLYFDLTKLKKIARPDMEWVVAVIDKVCADPAYFSRLEVRRNPLLFQSMDRIVLSFTRKKEEVSIRATSLVLQILERTQHGKKVECLIREILDQSPILDESKIGEVIQTLLNKEILLPMLLPSLLNENPFAQFQEHLSALSFPEISAKVAEVLSLLTLYHDSKVGEGEEPLRVLHSAMTAEALVKNPLQVDTCYPEEVFLSPEVGKEAQEAVEFLWKLSFARPRGPALKDYHEKFLEKYQTDRLVPLLDLLDEQVGIGIPENYPRLHSQSKQEENTEWTQYLSEAWFRCITEKTNEVVLTDENLKPFEEKIDDVLTPSSFDLFCELVANSPDSIDKGEFLICLQPFFGMGGGCSSLGRFLHLFGEAGKTKVSHFFAQEEALDPNALSVECSYFPSSPRSANVAILSNLRKHTLDLGGSSTSSLSLEDVFVGSTGKRFYFCRKEGGGELIFSASHFLNPEFAPLPLWFLAEASRERTQLVTPFSWGDLENMPFLPRVRYQRTILSPARWHVTLSLIQGKKNETVEVLAIKFSEWAKQQLLPRYLFLMDADNRLLLDLSQPFHLRVLVAQLKKSGMVTLIERIEIEEVVKSNRGSHRSEFVIPFLKSTPVKSVQRHSPHFTPILPQARWKAPHEEWMFAKLYLGSVTFRL